MRDLRRITLALACLLAGSGLGVRAQAQIYASRQAEADGDSAVVLSNHASPQTPLLLLTTAMPKEPEARTEGSRPRKLRTPPPEISRIVDEVAAELNVSPHLLHAVIAAESNYEPRAVSAKGAVGLMQLIPSTAQRFGTKDPLVARDNIRAGGRYLKWLLALFEGDLELALAAYNAGEQAVLKAGRRIPDFVETRSYVPRVLALLRCAQGGTCLKTPPGDGPSPRDAGVGPPP